jgi:hypothetical protein
LDVNNSRQAMLPPKETIPRATLPQAAWHWTRFALAPVVFEKGW